MAFWMRWPTDYGVITQKFGEHPENYARFGLPGHEGIDFMATEGSHVYAVADGTVSQVLLDGNSDPFQKPYGNQIRIRHAEGFTTIYAHLAQALVNVGQNVATGQVIGLADSTGNSSGPHLHLTLQKQGATQTHQTNYPYDIVDPTPYLEPFTGGAPPASTQVQVNSPDVGYLNVRSGPSLNNAIIGRAPDGTVLDAIEPADVVRSKVGQQGQWIEVRAPAGLVGYVAAWYLRLPGDVPPMTPVVVVSGATPLKVRGGPGTEYPIMAQAPDGTVLQALEPPDAVQARVGRLGQWLHVQTPGGVVGYCAAWYVRLQSDTSGTPLVVVSPQVPLKVRGGPGIQYSILAEAADGTLLYALEPPSVVQAKVGQPGQWLQVRTPNGVVGYSAAWYLRLPS